MAAITTANARPIGSLYGMRSDWLLGESLRAARRCATFDALLDATRELNTRCETPLSDDELVSTSHGAWNYQITGKNRAGQGGRRDEQERCQGATELAHDWRHDFLAQSEFYDLVEPQLTGQ